MHLKNMSIFNKLAWFKNLPLRNKLLLSYIFIILTTSFISTLVGVRLITQSIKPQIQNRVRLDLNSARELFKEDVLELRNKIELTAEKSFVQDMLLYEKNVKAFPLFKEIFTRESLDIMTIVDIKGHVIVRANNPKENTETQTLRALLKKTMALKKPLWSIEVLTKDELEIEGEDLAAKAYIKIVPTLFSKRNNKAEVTAGMLMVASAPVLDDMDKVLGVVYGGKLINNNYDIVDRIKDVIYGKDQYKGRDIGAVSIFQNDIRISTTVQTDNGGPALGTLIANDVDQRVLEKGERWTDRAFGVNNWYLTAYEPIRNSDNFIIGVLGLGLLENKFRDIQNNALTMFLLITFAAILLSLWISVLITKSIMKPINTLLCATQKLASGNFDQQVNLNNSSKEIRGLGAAFNFMITSIKDRDEKLKHQAQEEMMKAERLAILGRLAAGVAHEINNPLGSILLFSRLLLQKAPAEGLMRENLERVEKDAKRCQNIVQGLLDFARQRDPNIEAVDINDLLEKTTTLFNNHPLFHNIEIIRQYMPGISSISADPSQIMQVFFNIIMNAVDAMNGNGVLTIGTRSFAMDGSVEISIADTGCGIPPDKINDIFEPFFTTKPVGQGTGLGLSISYDIVHRHGGSIKVFSRTGEGSTFVICLPKIKEQP